MQPVASIKKNALRFGSLISLVIFVLMFVAAYQIAYHETDEILDQKLHNMAVWLADYHPLPVTSDYALSKKYSEEHVFVDVYLKSDWQQAQQHPIVFTLKKNAGYYTERRFGVDFIAYIIPLSDRQIQVAQPLHVRRVLAFELAGTMLIPYLILLPLVFFFLYWGIGRALRPIQRLQAEFSHREYDDLNALSTQAFPKELQAIVMEVNALFARIEKAQQQQNEFIAHAAHELRSPLTALNLQVRVLQQQYSDSATVLSLAQGLKRLQHLVQQLLDLAKQGEIQRQITEKISIQQLLKEVVQELYPLAQQKELDLALNAPEQEIFLCTDRHALLLVLRNLIDNAIKYSPVLGNIEITISLQQHFIEICIEDAGAGISESEYDNVMQKFYRIHNVGIGSGLGLAIVEKSLQRLNASLHFARSQTLGGLAVAVRFNRQ